MAEKIDIRGVPETMLQTLYARAKASQTEPHYIYDEKAIEIAAQLDYDFSAADKDYAGICTSLPNSRENWFYQKLFQ